MNQKELTDIHDNFKLKNPFDFDGLHTHISASLWLNLNFAADLS